VSISKANGVFTGALININNLLPDCSNLDGTLGSRGKEFNNPETPVPQ
jgi:hypothetical protein